jgi:hypothetical protein
LDLFHGSLFQSKERNVMTLLRLSKLLLKFPKYYETRIEESFTGRDKTTYWLFIFDPETKEDHVKISINGNIVMWKTEKSKSYSMDEKDYKI